MYLCSSMVFLISSHLAPWYTLLSNLFEAPAESLKHSLHVAAFLHRDDPCVVLLIHPDQETLLIVVPEGRRYSGQQASTGVDENFAHTRESKRVGQTHTRFLEHLASLEPFPLQSAMGTQVYQTENGPEENKRIWFKNSHSIIWAIYLFWPSLPSASFPPAPRIPFPVKDPHINKLLLFSLCHLTEPIVPSSQVTLQAT